MFESFLSRLKGAPAESREDAMARRKHARRNTDHCVTVIAGKTYPVENWSPGGVLIYGDSRPFAVKETIEVTMKFRLRNEVIDVPHIAKVVRKSYDKVAFEFAPLTQQIKKSFQAVVDDYLAAEFAESQLT